MPPLPKVVVAAVAAWLGAAACGAASEPSREARWLSEYLRIDTTNPPGHEARAAEFLARLLGAEGIATERYVTPDGRTSLVARLPATTPDGGTIALLHHLDVVPAGEGWSVAPFGGEIRDSAVWGRGAIDSKGLGIAELAAFLDAARSPMRRRGLLLLAVADEEAGGGRGTAFLLERHPERFAGVEAVLGEGGINRTVLGRTLFWGIEVAQKRPLWLEVVAHGRPGHASSFNPESAAHRLVRGLTRALEAPVRWKVSPPVRDYLEAVGRFDPQARAVARDLDRIAKTGEPTAAILPGMAGLFLDTLQITQLSASDRINVVAAEARASIDARILPDTDVDAFLAGLRERLGEELEVSVRLTAAESPPSPSDSSIWRELASGFDSTAPVVPVFISGITDARYFRERGIPAYGLSPFELELDLVRTVHGPDERLPLAALDAGVARMTRIVRTLVGASAGTRETAR